MPPANPLEKYRETVTMFLPDSCGLELGYRCRLAHFRDSAQASLRRCTDDVAPILEHVVRLSSDWIFSSDVDRLPEIDRAIATLYQAARKLNEATKETV